jgi:hypothetical protein
MVTLPPRAVCSSDDTRPVAGAALATGTDNTDAIGAAGDDDDGADDTKLLPARRAVSEMVTLPPRAVCRRDDARDIGVAFELGTFGLDDIFLLSFLSLEELLVGLYII